MGQVKFQDSKGFEHVLDVNVNSFIKLAGRTNNPDYGKVYKRMTDGDMNHGIPLLVKGIAAMLDGDLDNVKKKLFYGKPTDTSIINHIVKDCVLDKNLSMKHFKDNKEMIDIFHGIIGIATEAGEMLKALLGFMETGKFDYVNAGEETGDNLWYMSLILKHSGLSFEEVMTIVIQKLAERFKDGFTEDAAINRNVEAERVILENGFAENSRQDAIN